MEFIFANFAKLSWQYITQSKLYRWICFLGTATTIIRSFFFSQNNILENALILLPLSLLFLVIQKLVLVVISQLLYDLLNLLMAKINSLKFAIHGSIAKINFSKFSIFWHVNCENLFSENLCFRKFMPIR